MSEGKPRRPGLLARIFGKEPALSELAGRVNRAVESILGNERLTADLDDVAANALLEWGTACAQMIAQSTAGLDDVQADEVMSPRLRPTRRLMRLVNEWIANRQAMGDEDGSALLAKIVDQAAIIYGRDFTPPDPDQRAAFLKQQFEYADRPQQMIANLRTLLESSTTVSTASRGEENDQEKHDLND